MHHQHDDKRTYVLLSSWCKKEKDIPFSQHDDAKKTYYICPFRMQKGDVPFASGLLSTRLKLMVLFKVTASKLSLPKVETMRKSYYLNDNIFD